MIGLASLVICYTAMKWVVSVLDFALKDLTVAWTLYHWKLVLGEHRIAAGHLWGC
jgi:hypothetical protein